MCRRPFGAGRARIRLERAGVVGKGLAACCDVAGLVAGAEQEALRLLPVFGLRVVEGERAGELVQAIREVDF